MGEPTGMEVGVGVGSGGCGVAVAGGAGVAGIVVGAIVGVAVGGTVAVGDGVLVGSGTAVGSSRGAVCAHATAADNENTASIRPRYLTLARFNEQLLARQKVSFDFSTLTCLWLAKASAPENKQ